MFKRFLFLFAVTTLASCASMSEKHFTAISHNKSEIPRVYAWVAEDELGIQMNIDHRVMGVDIGDPYQASGGLIGAMAVMTAVSVEENAAYESIAPIQEIMSEFDFNETFESVLRDKILNPQLLPAGKLRYEPHPEHYHQWQSGTVSITAFQRFTQDFSSLWTGFSVYRFDETAEGKSVHRSAYLYVFDLPESVASYDSPELNLDIWTDNPALLEHQLRKGITSAMELLARDLEGNIDIEGAAVINVKRSILQRNVPDAFLVSQSERRSVIANEGRSLIALVPNSTIEGNDADRRSLSQVKLDEGIDDSAYQANHETARLNHSVQAADVMQFMGQAEEEINNKTYDRNLWARALVLAEGDSTKRVARYIELRAQQLAGLDPGSENMATMALADTAGQSEASEAEPNIDGVYQARVSASGYYFPTRSKLSFPLEIRQVGDEVFASSKRHDLKLEGVRNGDKVDFELVEVNAVSGLIGTFKGSWDVIDTGGGIVLTGRWQGKSHGGSGKFDLKKIRDL